MDDELKDDNGRAGADDGRARRSSEPSGRLTRICAAMTDAMCAHPEYSDEVHCMVFLQDGKHGGLTMYGYERDSEAIADLIFHLRAIFEVNGSQLMIVPLGKG
jgi:hypothetical protein